jgi:hypothetical protein
LREAPAEGGPLPIEAEEREVLLDELRALAGALRDPAALARYADLAQAAEAGEVAPDLVGDLERVLELTLETGRVRHMQGADGEQALLRLFGRTPRGEAVRRITGEANQALAALTGQTLRALAFSPHGPGTFRLEIATDLCRLTLEINRRGVTVDSVGIEA